MIWRVADERWQQALAQLAVNHQIRKRRCSESPQQPTMVMDGRELLTFCSNDYLGLSNDARVKKALIQGVERWGAGAGAAHLINGHTQAHQQLEEALAEFVGYPRALLFSTGFMANLAMVSALVESADKIHCDRLNHASLLDASRQSGARFGRFSHIDMSALGQALQKSVSRQQWVVTDSVFSMDGDCAPLPEIATLAARFQAEILVDEAHSLGVVGTEGRGLVYDCGLTDQVLALMGTLGKAFGVSGAFVAGSEAVIETLLQKARPYIYTTAMPAALSVAALESLRIIQTESWRREKLQTLISRFRHGAQSLGLSIMPSQSPIQPLLVGSSEAAVALSHKLEQQGFLVTAIRPPTVPQGQARLRITFSALHDEAMVDRLLDALSTCI